MFETLIESRSPGVRPGPSAVWSAFLHTLVVAVTVLATRAAVVAIERASEDPGPIWVPVAVPPAPPAAEPSEQSPSPERWFRPVPAITEMPAGIPEPEVQDRFSADSVSGLGTDRPALAREAPAAFSGAFLEQQVDEPVEMIHRPEPRYPALLQHAGIEGFVEARFVVDTTGHVEPDSWKVIASSNPGFELPTREALRHSQFRPARIKGRPVRQLVQQRFVFAISP